MSVKTFATLKQTEARARMASAGRAHKSPRRKLAQGQRHGLADGSAGRITNLAQVMQAMARWAEPV